MGDRSQTLHSSETPWSSAPCVCSPFAVERGGLRLLCPLQPGTGQRAPEDEKETIRRAIQKELKIKEGMENMRRVATDRRHLGHVQQLLRASNRRLEQLHGQLQELHAQVLLPASAGEWEV